MSCLAAVLSKALVSVSFVIFQYHGASFSYLTAVIEGYAPSRIITPVLGGRWASSVLIILILATSVVAKQMAAVSMGVEFMATNNTKISYTRNYTNCKAIMSSSGLNTIRTSLTAQVFAAMLIPNNSYTSEHYDSSIPPGLAGYSQFGRLLPYAEASCVQFRSSGFFDTVVPPVTGSGAWELKITLPFTAGVINGKWVNCTLKAGIANAISTCNDTKCETMHTTEDITPFVEGGSDLPLFLPFLFESYKPSGSMSNNIILTWLLGGDILRGFYVYNSDIPDKFTAESIADRLALLGTVMTRIICNVSSRLDFADVETTPATSNYIDHFHYQCKVLWRWPFYVLAGCIFIFWMLCMIAMWLVPESRFLSIDWLLNQYISGHQHGHLSGTDLIQAHRGANYQVYDGNANGDVGNIVISIKGLHNLDKYDIVVQQKQYQ